MSNRENFSTSVISSVQRKVDVGSVQINVEVVGNGSQTLLCLPGVLGTIESDFTPQLKDLQKEFTVVAWDPPGYGKSRPPRRDFSGRHMFYYRDAHGAHQLMKHTIRGAERILYYKEELWPDFTSEFGAVARQPFYIPCILNYSQLNLGFEKFSMIGWSDGGITSLIISELYPSSVEKLITIGANSYVHQSDISSANALKNLDNWSRKMVEPLFKAYGHEYLQNMWTEFLLAYEELHVNGGSICEDKLKDIKCPTLIVQGLKDAMVTVKHAEYLHKNISGSTLRIFPEGKHNLHLRYPDEFNALVREFMAN